MRVARCAVCLLSVSAMAAVFRGARPLVIRVRWGLG